MKDGQKSITEILTEISDEICEKYCKYPEQRLSGRESDDYDAMEDELHTQICANCPLMRI